MASIFGHKNCLYFWAKNRHKNCLYFWTQKLPLFLDTKIASIFGKKQTQKWPLFLGKKQTQKLPLFLGKEMTQKLPLFFGKKQTQN
jgi:hypothetical protein